MKLLRLVVPILAGLLLAGGTLVAFARGPAGPLPPPNASETDLLPGGFANAIHIDASGQLWISEVSSATVRRYNPATHAFTLFHGLTETVDAQIGPDGQLWWLDPPARKLARMDLGTRLVTTWPLSTSFSVALTFDSLGRAWIADFLSIGLYRLNPTTNEYCDVDLPDFGASETIVAQGGVLWVGDVYNSRIGRITPASNNFTYWSLAFAGGSPAPRGFTFGLNGEVWWADAGLRQLGRLEPAANRLTLFPVPGSAAPFQVAAQGSNVWFTAPFSHTLGFVDSATAAGGSPHVEAPTATTLAPDCVTIANGPSFTAGTSSGVAVFNPLVLTPTLTAQGSSYAAPVGGQPLGLAASGVDVWATDYGRDKLMLVDTTVAKLFLPLVRE